jgi:NAD-dependent SIR2 family protein deacetylase
MAWTARDDDEKKEYFDSPEELDRKVQQLADWIRESKHFFVFTGAGISTSAGIPDFRSGIDTVLETGPGAWELRAKGQQRDSQKHKVTSTLKAIPTTTHMALVRLQKEGLLKCVVSQNCDGLHRRSGLPKKALFELHGNSNVEKCTKCGHEYLRDFIVLTGLGLLHYTGRHCDDPECRGRLIDSIINFGESLPEEILRKSFDHAHTADLCVAMGSSLTVTPAANIPEVVGKRGQKLVIVNLQSTPMDHLCALRIFAKTDQVSQEKRERERVGGAAGVAGEQSADEEVRSGDPSVPATENSHHISYLHPLGPCGGGRGRSR